MEKDHSKEEAEFETAAAYMKEIAKRGSVLGLETMRQLMKELGDIQEKLSIIHIAGTNGKGSTGTFLSSVLQEAGFRVGRYTSPAVFDPMEIFSINGKRMEQSDYVKYVLNIKAVCESMRQKGMQQPTIFEVETAIAFLYFYEKKCDYVLLETGMGGTTDATNIILNPVCSVITSISMDHMQFLGNTLEAISEAKAGIIKPGCPVVTIVQSKDAAQVIETTAKQKKAPLFLADKNKVCNCNHIDAYEYPGLGRIQLQMRGSYQIENSVLAICTAKEVLHISPENILSGIQNAFWPGRFEVVGNHPVFILDGAHNEDAAKKLSETMANDFPGKELTYIVGILKDKDYHKILEYMMPLATRAYTITPANVRGLSGEILAEEAAYYHKPVEFCPSVSEAVEKAYQNTNREGVILAFGSLSYLGEVKKALEKR